MILKTPSKLNNTGKKSSKPSKGNLMKLIKNIALIAGIISSLHAQTNDLFLEKIKPIAHNLYKLSSDELYEIVGLAAQSFTLITADQLKPELENKKDIRVVNVLTKNYHDDCHITGSINAPLPHLVELAQSWDRSQTIVIYCALAECDASEKGCTLLKCMGFTNILEYKGGIKEWYQLHYPTTGPAESEYLHTKGSIMDLQYKFYPKTIVCSMQTRWAHRYKQ